jgi:hypothetical protein
MSYRYHHYLDILEYRCESLLELLVTPRALFVVRAFTMAPLSSPSRSIVLSIQIDQRTIDRRKNERMNSMEPLDAHLLIDQDSIDQDSSDQDSTDQDSSDQESSDQDTPSGISDHELIDAAVMNNLLEVRQFF